VSNAPQVRIAIRQEGAFINAYIAGMKDMKDAKLIGSISLALCELDRVHFERFVVVMSDGFKALVEQTGLTVTDMQQQAAPEHEKAGHG
jgi:hypothetical protein